MYHIRATLTTAGRILAQLRHDPRTLGMLFVVPIGLLLLFRWMFTDTLTTFNYFAPALLGVFPFVIMFLITSVTTLRERTSGTLERLMTMRIGKLDIVLGYMIAFGIIAIIQAVLSSIVLLYILNLDIAGPHWYLVVIALLDALLGTALGLFVSAFAKTEFQAVQFMPAFIIPQLLIGGLFVPLSKLPDVLDWIAHALPMTYAIDALNLVATTATLPDKAWRDLWVVVGCIIAAVLLGALTLRRRTK